jgi:hypothetical protein
VRRSRVLVLTLLVACVVAPASAQRSTDYHPNFSGVWHLLEDRSVTHQQGEPVVVSVWPSTVRVRHGRAHLVIALDTDERVSRSYRMDGQPTVNKVPGPNGQTETVGTATWSGSRLVITERPKDDDEGESVRRLTLNPDGTLSVEAPWGEDGAFVASVYGRSR